MPGDRVHRIMQGVLYAPPLQGEGTTETRVPATRLHRARCRAGHRPKLTDTTTKGREIMDLLGILLVAWFVWMIWGMWKK